MLFYPEILIMKVINLYILLADVSAFDHQSWNPNQIWGVWGSIFGLWRDSNIYNEGKLWFTHMGMFILSRWCQNIVKWSQFTIWLIVETSLVSTNLGLSGILVWIILFFFFLFVCLFFGHSGGFVEEFHCDKQLQAYLNVIIGYLNLLCEVHVQVFCPFILFFYFLLF